jgi:hypothetical protein
MGTSTVEILHDYIGAVWFERDAIIRIRDIAVLDDNRI